MIPRDERMLFGLAYSEDADLELLRRVTNAPSTMFE
jgi:hypothetical protein